MGGGGESKVPVRLQARPLSAAMKRKYVFLEGTNSKILPEKSENARWNGKQALGCGIFAVHPVHAHACAGAHERTRPEHLKALGHHRL